jgi:putative NIF3 family GTP cyclohydrolase 1 type 2
VVDRIKQHLGVPWREGPTDTFKTGDANSAITGVATTVMSTFDVIKRALARKNVVIVITHEPTFWTGNDELRNFADDVLYQQKLRFIHDNGVVVWRFHDNLHAHQEMRLGANWLKSFVTEVPVEWIPAGDPFWRLWHLAQQAHNGEGRRAECDLHLWMEDSALVS